jgi:hypothetical protein
MRSSAAAPRAHPNGDPASGAGPGDTGEGELSTAGEDAGIREGHLTLLCGWVSRTAGSSIQDHGASAVPQDAADGADLVKIAVARGLPTELSTLFPQTRWRFGDGRGGDRFRLGLQDLRLVPEGVHLLERGRSVGHAATRELALDVGKPGDES